MIKALCQVDDIADVPNDTELTVEEIKNNLNYLEADQRQFFYYLYGATMPKDDKLISEIKFEIELNNGTVITIDDFSEGEKKNLLIQFILETVADENSLILFDEPDSHIHVSRKVELKNTLDKYPNRENIWTTHSPSLASAFGDNHIIGLGDDTKGSVKIIDKGNADLISYITNGMWDIHQQNVFLSSNKPVTLLVEGLTDKLILAQAFKVLKDDYKSLKFDVFHCGGADNIPHLLTGLRTTDFKLGNKKIIALFDSDTEGLDCCNRSQVKYSKAKNKKGLYAIVLPKKNATIESFFPTQKFNDAYTEALSENPFNGSVTDFSKNLMTKSKIKLSENCKNFAAQDFDEFRSIFDLLEEINNL
jgi:predicted ATP-dependent endonuclease of OLD family